MRPRLLSRPFLVISVAICSVRIAAAQDVHVLDWRALQRPATVSPRAPHLILPPDLPGRQTLLSVLGPTDEDDAGAEPDAVDVDGPRRYLDLRIGPEGERVRWADFRGLVLVYPGGLSDSAAQVAAYDTIADRLVAPLRDAVAALPVERMSAAGVQEVRAAVAALPKRYLKEILGRRAAPLERQVALVALCRAGGLSARVGFGLLQWSSFKPTREAWVECYVPGSGWATVTPVADYEPIELDAGEAKLITFGFVSIPDLSVTAASSVPAYPLAKAEAWLDSRVGIRADDAVPALFDIIHPLYRAADSLFVARADAVLTLVPGDFQVRLFRAVSLSRLGRRAEAAAEFEDMLAHRRALSNDDYAHLLWAFAKHLAWGGHVEIAKRYVKEARALRELWHAGGFDIRADPDWDAIRGGLPQD